MKIKYQISVFQATLDVFHIVRMDLISKWEDFAGIYGEKKLREGPSSVLKADLFAERELVPALRKLWPDIPFLCEESENSMLVDLVPGIKLLDYGDIVAHLPKDYASIDGVDGSALYENCVFELVAMMAGRIENSAPVAGMVMTLSDSRMYHTGVNGREGVFEGHRRHEQWVVPKRPLNQCLIGTDDNKAVDTAFRSLFLNKLTGSKGTRYPLNNPSGVGALNVLKGRLAAYVTSNARNWDLVATAALCEAAGMIVRCLDGSPVPWNRVRMPPVVYARDEEAFAYVHGLAKEYLAQAN